jgi:hypothetical protein
MATLAFAWSCRRTNAINWPSDDALGCGVFIDLNGRFCQHPEVLPRGKLRQLAGFDYCVREEVRR